MNLKEATQKTTNEKLYFQGIGECRVVAINPNKEELESLLGVEIQEDPKYIVEKQDGSKSTRITCWLEPKEYIGSYVPMTIFMSHNIKKSKDGSKTLFITGWNNETWATNKEEIIERYNSNEKMQTFFTLDKLREAYDGEVSLYNFILTLGNIQSKQTVEFNSIQNIINGDVSELRELLKFWEEKNESPSYIKVLFGLKTNNDSGKVYQDVWTGGFVNARSNKYTNFAEKANGDYGFKSNWGNDTQLRIVDIEKPLANKEDVQKGAIEKANYY